MENVSVNVTLQMDVSAQGDDNIKDEVVAILSEMNKTLQQRFNDISPIIFTNSIDKSDITVYPTDDDDDDY